MNVRQQTNQPTNKETELLTGIANKCGSRLKRNKILQVGTMDKTHHWHRAVKILISGSQLVIVTILFLLSPCIPLAILGLTALCFHFFYLFWCYHDHPLELLTLYGLILVDLIQFIATTTVAVSLQTSKQQIAHNNAAVIQNGDASSLTTSTELAFLYPYSVLLIVSLLCSILDIPRKTRSRQKPDSHAGRIAEDRSVQSPERALAVVSVHSSGKPFVD